MTDRIQAIEALLAQAKAAHAEYERTELNGVYDEDWAQWYAAFIAAYGLADLVGRPTDVSEVASFLQGAWAEQERAAPAEPWESYTARRIATELVR